MSPITMSLFKKAGMSSLTVFAIASAASLSAFGAGKLSDSEIVAIVEASNSVDISHAQIAKSKSQNKMVQEFANHMIHDHSSGNQSAMKTASKLEVSPKENEASRSLKQDGSKTAEKLQTVQAKEFDKEYVNNEVKFHEKVLNDIDKELMPNAKSPEVKKLLSETRPVVVSHLAHAKTLKENLEQSESTRTG